MNGPSSDLNRGNHRGSGENGANGIASVRNLPSTTLTLQLQLRAMLEDIPYIGEMFALAAPITWSFAVILFRRTGEVVPPVALTTFKTFLVLPLFAITVLITGDSLGLGDASWNEVFLLLVSGALGLGVSDLLFFYTLNRVGAALESILNTAYSPTIIVLSVLFLGETLGPIQVLGVGLILGAVLAVGWMKGTPEQSLTRRDLWIGIALGTTTALTQGVSVVTVKPLLERSPLMWANWWRLLGGILSLPLLLIVFPRGSWGFRKLADRHIWRVMLPGSILGTYVSLVVWLAGMKYAQASVAAALNQTATLFTFILAVILLGEPATRIRIAGLAVGFAGVMLVTFG